MHDLTTLEVSFLVKELQQYIDSFIEKFYEIEENKFRLKIKKNGVEQNLLCILCKTFNSTNYIEKIDNPSNFSLAVRKRITGYKIIEIKQLENDRIIQFKLQKKDEFVNIIFEMFGKGNFVITDNNMHILLAYKVHEFKDRSVTPKSVYLFPKKSERNETFEQILNVSKGKKILQTFSNYYNIGSIYIENELIKLNIDPKAKIDTIDSEYIKRIDTIFKSLFYDNPIKNIVYLKDGVILEYSIMELKKYDNYDKNTFETFEKLLDFIYSNNISINSDIKNPEYERIYNSINKQKEILKNIDSEISLNKHIGAFIFENMNILNHLLIQIKENENLSIYELKNFTQDFSILKIDKKEKFIEIEILDKQ